MVTFGNDLLSQALGLMRITGSLLRVEGYAPPWAVAIPGQVELLRLLKPARDSRIVAFHLVHCGLFTLYGEDGTQIDVCEGDVVVALGGMPHILSQGNRTVPMTLETHLERADSTVRPSFPPQAPTALICGLFVMRDTHLNPLFAGLPTFLHLRPAVLAASGLSLTIPALLTREIMQRGHGSDYVTQRLLELMCVDILRAYMQVSGESLRGWLRVIQDPGLGKAPYRFHESPGESWSVSRLAAEANLSPSRFAARFTEVMGESCMSYVRRWRLNVARSLLQTTAASIDEIAHHVGYENVPAFTRVFRRYIGITPGHWRKQQER